MNARTLLAAGILLAGAAGTADAAWPERPISLIVPWSAGGGTDATGRIVASLLEEELGQPVTVINRTGGGGVVGHTEIATAEPDGYTLGVLTTELSMFHWVGTSPLTHENYTLLGLYNTDPIGLHVAKDGPADAKALVEQIRSEPGRHKASGANLGGAAHLALAGLLDRLGLETKAAPWVPSEGATPSLQLLVSGAIGMVSTTLPEARGMVDAGEARTLLVMADEPAAGFEQVPTA
ncbi:tripartite tricarboxylate transporter substrate-binding protein [Marinimicrococcus flavescens]|uniref:Tripartite tricarboxylate transporter substrate-binding protein n=1 Tax=Marinimicrococcus flavescens TaxID=3031815 RepID=A0AAP3V0J3_9PROT|nr:tripartite tricarboxylate transporter substrate-binding protein [Marinimicrococcus flavescens]